MNNHGQFSLRSLLEIPAGLMMFGVMVLIYGTILSAVVIPILNNANSVLFTGTIILLLALIPLIMFILWLSDIINRGTAQPTYIRQ